MTASLSLADTQPVSILTLPHGLHPNVPDAVYHARELGIANKTALDKLHRSPAHLMAWLAGSDDDGGTDAKDLGKAFHCALLEPARFAREYAVEPAFGDCRFKEAKARRDAWRAENEGKIHLSANDDAAIAAMVVSVKNHPIATRMLLDGEPEITARFRDPETGLECKARADYFVRRLRMAVDVKTCRDARLEAFRKSVANYGYHRQDAFYRRGFAAAGHELEHFVFLCVETEPPYLVALFALDHDAVNRGSASISADLRTYARCLELGEWPGYETGIQTLDLPTWA